MENVRRKNNFELEMINGVGTLTIAYEKKEGEKKDDYQY